MITGKAAGPVQALSSWSGRGGVQDGQPRPAGQKRGGSGEKWVDGRTDGLTWGAPKPVRPSHGCIPKVERRTDTKPLLASTRGLPRRRVGAFLNCNQLSPGRPALRSGETNLSDRPSNGGKPRAQLSRISRPRFAVTVPASAMWLE